MDKKEERIEDDGQHHQEAKQPCDECASSLLLKDDQLLRLHDLGALVVDIIDHNQDGRLSGQTLCPYVVLKKFLLKAAHVYE